MKFSLFKRNATLDIIEHRATDVSENAPQLDLNLHSTSNDSIDVVVHCEKAEEDNDDTMMTSLTEFFNIHRCNVIWV